MTFMSTWNSNSVFEATVTIELPLVIDCDLSHTLKAWYCIQNVPVFLHGTFFGPNDQPLSLCPFKRGIVLDLIVLMLENCFGLLGNVSTGERGSDRHFLY